MASPFLYIVLLLFLLPPHPAIAADGKWQQLMPNVGIAAMHMQLLHTDHVIMYDRTDFGRSNISLADGKCRHNRRDIALKVDCTAHSVEYDVAANKVRPLMVQTDVWCSSGAVMPDGSLVQAGGFNDGDHAVRVFKPCRDGSCDWEEINPGLTQRRWYATSHRLPDGRQIVIGGRKQFNYEFYPKIFRADASYDMPFLFETSDQGSENNLYPAVFLNEDGNLFIFANNRAILFDYMEGKVVRTYPMIPGGDPRSYPSTGSAVLLPIRRGRGAEVLVCGGAPRGSFARANRGVFLRALNTCARIKINDLNPQWAMETMPSDRVMGDMLLLPNGNVLIINGARAGTAGWEVGRAPQLAPVVYYPDNPVGSRFEVENPSNTPRMYHSTAVLLRDGRVLIAGSNPHQYYEFTNVMFPTELSLEAFSPSYLNPKFANLRPQIVAPDSQSGFKYGQRTWIRITMPHGRLDHTSLMMTMISPSFTTHSFSMNQRLLVLDHGDVATVDRLTYQVPVTIPVSNKLAPPGYYLLFVVHKDIPSKAIWINIH